MHDLPLFYAPDIEQSKQLPEDEAGHALRVLRLAEGAVVALTDGRGSFYKARLSEVGKKSCGLDLIEALTWQPYWQGEISLCVVPTKSMERMEWLLEKAVELGLNRIILLKTKHSERKHINTDRLRKILISAMKQSQKALLPELIVGVSLEEALTMTTTSTRLILHCREHSSLRHRILPHQAYQVGGDVALFIGPEGDFTLEEVALAEQNGVCGVSLGESRLRTETAALVALQWIHTLQMIRN